MPSRGFQDANSVAEKSSVNPWPDLLESSNSGTQVAFSGGFHDADVVITTYKEYGEDRLIRLAKQVATRANYPNCDYSISRGRRLICVDIMFDKFVRHEDGVATFNFPAGDIVLCLSESDVPKPIGVILEAGKHVEGELNGLRGTRRMLESEVFTPKSLGYPTSYSFQIKRSFIGLVGAICEGFFTLAAVTAFPVIVYFLIFPRKKKVAEPPEVDPNAAEPSLTANQTKYEQTRRRLLPLLLLPFLLVMQLAGPAMHYSNEWIPPDLAHAATNLTIWVTVPFCLLLPAVLLVRNSRERRKQADTTTNPLRIMPFLLIPMVILFGLLMFGQSTLSLRIPVETYRLMVRGTLAATFGILAVGIIYNMRRQTVRLEPGDPDYDYAMSLATSANVRLRAVRLSKTPTANAAATLFRTIILTSGVREKMSVEERRAIIAHEVGHLKYSHVPIYFAVTLALNLVFFAIYFSAQTYLRQAYPNVREFLVLSPLLLNMALIFGIRLVASPLSRKNELAADRFALQSIGSFTVVATALSRIHLLNGSPHTYMGLDKVAGTHPSLLKRIDSLRIAAGELGMEASFDPFAPLPGADLPPVIAGV